MVGIVDWQRKIAVARVNETGKDIQDLKEKEGRKKEVKKKNEGEKT